MVDRKEKDRIDAKGELTLTQAWIVRWCMALEKILEELLGELLADGSPWWEEEESCCARSKICGSLDIGVRDQLLLT